MSRDVHPVCTASLPPSSATLNVTMPREDVTAIHRVFCASSQLASAVDSIFSLAATAVVATGPPVNVVLNRYNLPPPLAATRSLSFTAKISGDELKFAPGT